MRGRPLRSALLAATVVVALAGCSSDSSDEGCLGGDLATSVVEGNGSNGNMFDVVARVDLAVSGLTANLWPGQTDVTVEIYHREGSHVGHEAIAGDWTLAGSAVVDAAASGPTPIPVPLWITIPAGGRHAFYVTGAGAFVGYADGSAVGAVAADDGNLQILEGTGNGYPFGTTFSPRIYVGAVRYARCP